MAHDRDFLPGREADLLTWSVNFKAKITATPEAYGLDGEQAASYGALHDSAATSFQTSADPSTRTPSSIVAKRAAFAALRSEARELARIVQATPFVTNTQRSDLGLTVRSEEPSPIPPPADAPELDIVRVTGRTVRIRLHNENSIGRRGKPHGVAGATVFSFVGDAPPNQISAWKFETSTTRTVVDIQFPPNLAPGTRVFLTGFWFNPRAQSGPACSPQSAYLGAGISMAA